MGLHPLCDKERHSFFALFGIEGHTPPTGRPPEWNALAMPRSPLSEQVEAVMECQLEYLRYIGAIGREADDET